MKVVHSFVKTPASKSTVSMNSGQKRKLIEDIELVRPRKKRTSQAAAILSTRNAKDIVDKLIVAVDHPITIGRSPASDYVLTDKTISSKHCTIHAVVADTGKISIVCQDFSSNGVIVNNVPYARRASILLMNGDILQLPGSQRFHCEHLVAFQQSPPPSLTPTLKNAPERVGDYRITRHMLGSGAYSSVFLAIDTGKRRQVACKTIIRKTQADIEDVLKEADLLKRLRHPNINAVFGFEIRGELLHIFLELATGGDLFSYLVKNGKICEGETKYITFQLMKGLKYIYDRKISHRDLKPENVLLATPGSYPRVVIADFGLARERSYELTGNVAGTVSYLPPEAIHAMDRNQKYVSQDSDAWSLGLIIFAMLVGYHPFDANYEAAQQSAYPYDNQGQYMPVMGSEEFVQRRIVQKELIFQPNEWKNLVLAQDLISKLLLRDYEARETIQGAMDHKWIQMDKVSLQKAYQDRVETAFES